MSNTELVFLRPSRETWIFMQMRTGPIQMTKNYFGLENGRLNPLSFLKVQLLSLKNNRCQILNGATISSIEETYFQVEVEEARCCVMTGKTEENLDESIEHSSLVSHNFLTFKAIFCN